MDSSQGEICLALKHSKTRIAWKRSPLSVCAEGDEEPEDSDASEDSERVS